MRRFLVLVAALGATSLLAQPVQACPYEDLVKSYYHRYLNRCPQSCEVSGWVGHLRRGSSPEEVQVGFLSGEEYWCKCERCPECYVRTLYKDVLGREPCRREIAAWVDAMRCGCRVKVSRRFLCEAGKELAQRPAYTPPRVVAPGPLEVPQPSYQDQGTWSSGYRGRPTSDPRNSSIRIIYVR